MTKRSIHSGVQLAMNALAISLPIALTFLVSATPGSAQGQSDPNLGANPIRVPRDAQPQRYAPNGAPIYNNYTPQNSQSSYMQQYPANNNNMHGTRDRPPSSTPIGGFLGRLTGGGGGGGYGGGGSSNSSVGVSDSTLQMRRWEQQFRDEHPGEPMPNMGQLQKMHSGELQAEIQRGGQAMWAKRQADLKHSYQMSRDFQAQKNAANHENWTSAQWSAWDRSYDQSQRDQAEAYKEGVRVSGEMARAEEFKRRNGFDPPPGYHP